MPESRLLYLAVRVDRVVNVKEKIHFTLSVLIGGLLSLTLVSCTAHRVKTMAAAQTSDAQQSLSSSNEDAQRSASPVSLETFSAFLDRC